MKLLNSQVLYVEKPRAKRPAMSESKEVTVLEADKEVAVAVPQGDLEENMWSHLYATSSFPDVAAVICQFLDKDSSARKSHRALYLRCKLTLQQQDKRMGRYRHGLHCAISTVACARRMSAAAVRHIRSVWASMEAYVSMQRQEPAMLHWPVAAEPAFMVAMPGAGEDVGGVRGAVAEASAGATKVHWRDCRVWRRRPLATTVVDLRQVAGQCC